MNRNNKYIFEYKKKNPKIHISLRPNDNIIMKINPQLYNTWSAAGILLYTIINKELYFFVGNELRKGKNIIHFPCGKREDYEYRPEETAKREFEEETNLFLPKMKNNIYLWLKSANCYIIIYYFDIKREKMIENSNTNEILKNMNFIKYKYLKNNIKNSFLGQILNNRLFSKLFDTIEKKKINYKDIYNIKLEYNKQN